MIKLYGIRISNYYNAVRLSLLEKDIAFEEVSIFPNQKEDYVAKSPMGKVPCIETVEGFLSESSAIFDYLEDLQPSPAMYPADSFARAKVKEIGKVIELYIDLPARRHLPTVYFGAPENKVAVEEARPVLEKGLRALQQLGQFDPFIMGSELTFADCAAFFHFSLANTITQAIYDWDMIADVPGLQASLDHIGERETTAIVASEAAVALAELKARNS